MCCHKPIETLLSEDSSTRAGGFQNVSSTVAVSSDSHVVFEALTGAFEQRLVQAQLRELQQSPLKIEYNLSPALMPTWLPLNFW